MTCFESYSFSILWYNFLNVSFSLAFVMTCSEWQALSLLQFCFCFQFASVLFLFSVCFSSVFVFSLFQFSFLF
jgi:hypothetical protein